METSFECELLLMSGRKATVQVTLTLCPGHHRAAAAVKIKLCYPHWVIAADTPTERAYLPRFAEQLHRVVVGQSERAVLADWDSELLLRLEALEPGAERVAMGGRFRDYIAPPSALSRDEYLRRRLGSWQLETAFQGLLVTRQDVSRLAELVERFLESSSAEPEGGATIAGGH
jgi:hypothetical protein